MVESQILEKALGAALHSAHGVGCPPKLAEALRYAVFPGGARVRPKLVLAVASACGAGANPAAIAGACALEFLHCASLVHDDLPCFDGAAFRRGKPSVHVAFGERIAVLTGDALIVQAFLVAAQFPAVATLVAQAVGAPDGICAGQAWECEPQMDLVRYQRSKTGALFAGATMVGAAAAGRDAAPWAATGMLLGEAFQVADDLRDVAGVTGEIGKPTGQDAAHNLPNAVSTLGFEGAVTYFDQLMQRAIAAIPDCPGAAALSEQIMAVTKAMVPKRLARGAA